jgi:hypothetical protein
MTILKNFDMDALRRERAKKAARGGKDLVEALRQISPDIENLKVGDTAKIAIPEGVGLRKFVMSITAKLNNLTPKEAPWAGRTFAIANDGAGNVYVQRGKDETPRVVKRGGGGGRKPKASTPATSTSESGAKVTENA